MSKVPNRKKLRREYVKTKAGSYASIAMSTLLIVPVALLFVFLSIGVCVCVFSRDVWNTTRIVVSTLLICFCTLAGFTLRWCIRDIRATRQKAALIEFVPPVTPDTLPAEEILVRGSEEPTVVQSETLLRAASRQETPKEELLRMISEE